MEFFLDKKLPEDYHCDCHFCKKFIGSILTKEKKYFNVRKRTGYSKAEKIHICKTPPQIAQWAIETYTKKDDWVFDPTVGVGTTIIESLKLGRNTGGIELNTDYFSAINQSVNLHEGNKAIVINDDARNIYNYLGRFPKRVKLIVNNPPYSGDENQQGFKDITGGRYNRKYDKNLAFLKEKEEYYQVLKEIYLGCIELLEKGGHFVIGVKDMVRNKRAYLLHKFIGELIEKELKYIGMALLRHHPPTLFMNTYSKRFPEVKIPRDQTILVFKK